MLKTMLIMILYLVYVLARKYASFVAMLWPGRIIPQNVEYSTEKKRQLIDNALFELIGKGKSV